MSGTPAIRPATASALRWSILGEAATRIASPVVLLVLAALLSPEDFGVVAAATVVIALAQALSEAGLGRAIVQRQDRVHDAATTGFWMNLAFALLLAAALVFCAPAIARFFDAPDVAPVTAVLALQLPLAALGTIHTALLQRELAFRRIFFARLASATLPALVSVPMALAGHGYWALVLGSLAGQAVQAIILWHRAPWSPRPAFDVQLAGELIAFGKWAMASAVFAWAFGWLDTVVVGHYLGTATMGLYRTGASLVLLAFGLVFAPLLPVVYSLMARTAGDPGRISANVMEFASSAMALSLPVAAIALAVGPEVDALLGESGWHGIGNVMALFAVAQAFAWLVGANGEAYRALGKPQVETWIMGVSLLAYAAGYLAVIGAGLTALLLMRIGLTGLGLAAQILIAHRVLGTRIGDWLAAVIRPLAAALLAYLAAEWLVPELTPIATGLAEAATIAVVYFVLMFAVLDRRRIRILWSFVRAA